MEGDLRLQSHAFKIKRNVSHHETRDVIGCDDVILEPTKCTLQKQHDRFSFLQSYLKPEEQ